MSEANNSNLISDSDTDYDSNSDTDINIETYIKDTNKNLQKVYQIQHLLDLIYS
jgi:hypothetical protein